MDELYLDNIDEYINDHNKIVTYKWLSLTLGVHVNTAKQMLYHYLDHKRNESSAQLHATYLVSGKFVDKGQTCHKVSVVREDQLEDFKAKMSPVVSVHVYSVQKALLKDSAPLYSVDYDAVKDNLTNCCKYSAIRCPSAVPMSSVELQQVREMQHSSTPEPETKKSFVNGDASAASKKPAKPQKGIMGMFASKPKNQDNVSEIKSEVKEEAPEVEAPKSKPAVKANLMMNFFGNQTAKKTEKAVKQQEEKQPAAPSSTRSEQQQKSPEKKQEATTAEPQKEIKKESSKTKRIVDSDSEEEKMEKKKRRRIKKPQPDSSDEDVIPDSPPQIEIKPRLPSPKKEPVSVTHSLRNPEIRIRKRRQVLKAQMFVDEDGCMVTEKGYVSESYSESEDDFKQAKQASREPVKVKPPSSSKDDQKKSQKKASASANKGAKQASIMGFFQKK